MQTARKAYLDPITLRDFLVGRFQLDELQLLCFDITARLAYDGIFQKVDLDDIGHPDSGLSVRVVQLIKYLQDRDWLEYLELIRK